MVTITYVPDSSIVIFVLALAALFFLIAISGRLWTLKYGDTELSPEVKPTSEAEAKKRQDAGEAEQVISKSGQDLYSRLDQEVVHALDARWRYWYDMSVASKITQVKRATGKGNHAWFIEANTPEGNKIWVRVTKGGRSGGMRAIRH